MKLDTTSMQMPVERSFETRRSLLLTSGAALALACGVVRIASAQPAEAAGSAPLRVLDPQRAGELVADGGAPRIVHLWGLSCAPCIEELPHWGDFARRHRDWRLVFLQVDPAPAKRITAALRRAGLESVENWTLASPLDERACDTASIPAGRESCRAR